jgi:hypothetical protein
MKPEIATLHERMAKGGDWRGWRDEIAALHASATTEDEYVTVLEAHRNLVAVGKYAFDEETYAKLLPITRAEYLMFLNEEAAEDGVINPLLLGCITRREVEAGRLHPGDEFRKLAAAGANVLGDSAPIFAHRCKHGDFLFYGAAGAAVLAWGMQQFHVSPLWLIILALAIAWFLNDRENRRIKREVAARRA